MAAREAQVGDENQITAICAQVLHLTALNKYPSRYNCEAMIDSLAQFFQREQRRGQIVTTTSPTAIACLFMTIYQGEVRQWLQAERPSASDGLKRLQQSFSLALSGVKISVASD